jgi:acetylornithine deacetylase/succinyl-diaminopimelate desuccinylase-like protein
VARVVAYVPDLLFGSNVVGALRAVGDDVELVGEPGTIDPGVDVLVVDLTADPAQRIERVGALELHGARVLAFYSHVEADVRALAEQAGFALVVPRSRMAREGAALVARLATR